MDTLRANINLRIKVLYNVKDWCSQVPSLPLGNLQGARRHHH